VIRRLHFMRILPVLALTALAQAQTFKVLYAFNEGSGGDQPWAGVIQSESGDLYGTTEYGVGSGCPEGCGVVYKLNKAGTETVLLAFSGTDGAYPVAPVVRDKEGNIYGTTPASADYGNAFKVNTAGNETVLHNFTGKSDGCYPAQGLILDSSGDLFGTTPSCGSAGNGTIFKINHAGKFTVLHSFAGPPSDGASPYNGHLSMDKSGNLYGVTSAGGAHGGGAVYKLSSDGKLILLHSFAGHPSDGCYPYGSVLQDRAGNFYGTSYECGSNYYGTIWKVSKSGKETVLHNFVGGSVDGCYPYGGVAQDSKGNLYGLTAECGADGYGTLYELDASGRLTLLHSFAWSDGANPLGEVLRNAKGALFGTSYDGANGCGSYSCGTVWSYVP
jgi:uncharacterized repeat protein (TIGR03803 family)